jgi:tetratricopeptide (TPR) repeat protein
MNVAKLVKHAEKLVSYGKISEAISVYQEILSEDFHNTTIHNLIADLYIAKQDTHRASRHLFKVAADYSSQGDQTSVISVYRKIISIQPRNVLAREKLLEIFSKSGSKSEIPSLISELCAIYEGEGNTPKVIECLEKLVALEPTNSNQQMKLALLLAQSGSKSRAIEILYQIARESFRGDRYDEALASLEKIKAIDPKDKNIGLRLAEVFEQQGKIHQAIEAVKSALADDPQQLPLASYLAKLFVKAGQVEEAEKIYETLAGNDQNFLPDVFPFIEILISNKKIDGAVHYIEGFYQQIKDKEGRKKCAELLEEVLKLDPQNLDAYRLLEAFYSSSFQFDQLAITLLSHADAYLAKCEYARAFDLAKQFVDLEPYNEEFRKKYQFIEKLASGESHAVKPAAKPQSAPETNAEEEGDEEYANARVDSHFDEKISLVTDDDVESFIVDVELLEKFGQQVNAIRRLEQVLKTHPHEIRLRQKLKSIYVDRKMPKKAAQECLEIAKILQQRDQKEEANKYLREAQRLNPLLSSAKRNPSPGTSGLADIQPGPAAKSGEETVSLRGDLSEIGLLDVIQILDNAQKSGKLVISSEGNPGTIFFNSGRIVNATYQDKVGEPAVYALVAVKGGNFDYKPSSVAFDVVISNSNTNLLLEGLRLLDEANRDPSETETPPEEPVPSAASHSPNISPPKSDASPSPTLLGTAIPVLAGTDETNPLEGF